MGKWKTCTIADLGTVVGGATPSTKKSENYDGGTIAWITPKDLAELSGRFISHGERNITQTGLNSCSAQMMPKHTVLFSSRAPIGYVAIAENDVCTNQGFKSVVPNENTDYMFLYYLLLNNKQNIEHMGSGTTFKEVSGKTMRSIQVRVPELKEEQIRISSMLSVIDDKIEENERINKNLEQQAQTLFDHFYDCLSGQACTLSEIIDIRDGTHDSPKATNNGYPLVTSKHLLPFGVDTSSANIISKADYDKVNERSKVNTGDILISMIGTVGLISYVIDSPVEFAIKNVGLFKTSQHPSLDLYILYYLKSISVTHHIERCLAGSTQKYISLGELRKLPILVPSQQELDAYNSVVRPIVSEIILLVQENRKLSNIRDLLLPKLMTGELDVSEINL